MGQQPVPAPLIDEYVGLEEVDDGIWNLHFGSLLLGRFDERDDDEVTVDKCYPCAWTKVLPMCQTVQPASSSGYAATVTYVARVFGSGTSRPSERSPSI